GCCRLPRGNTELPMAEAGELDRILRLAVVESRSHFSADTLPPVSELRTAVKGARARFWERLPVLEAFLVFEASPETAAMAGQHSVASARCGALGQVPGD